MNASRPRHMRTSEEDWPASCRIIFSTSGKVNLTDQQPHMQNMLRAAITRILEYLVFENSYPDLELRRKITGDILLACTDERPEFEAVKSRLMKDPKYVRALASVVCV